MTIRTPPRSSTRRSAGTPINSSSGSGSRGEELQGEGIALAREVLLERLAEGLSLISRARMAGCVRTDGPCHSFRGPGEQRHARAELEVIRVTEDRLDTAPFDAVHEPGALAQSRPEHRMREIGARLLQLADRVMTRRRARAEALELRDDETHAIALLPARPVVRADLREDSLS